MAGLNIARISGLHNCWLLATSRCNSDCRHIRALNS